MSTHISTISPASTVVSHGARGLLARIAGAGSLEALQAGGHDALLEMLAKRGAGNWRLSLYIILAKKSIS